MICTKGLSNIKIITNWRRDKRKKQALQDGIYDENKQQNDIKFSGDELMKLLG